MFFCDHSLVMDPASRLKECTCSTQCAEEGSRRHSTRRVILDGAPGQSHHTNPYHSRYYACHEGLVHPCILLQEEPSKRRAAHRQSGHSIDVALHCLTNASLSLAWLLAGSRRVPSKWGVCVELFVYTSRILLVFRDGVQWGALTTHCEIVSAFVVGHNTQMAFWENAMFHGNGMLVKGAGLPLFRVCLVTPMGVLPPFGSLYLLKRMRFRSTHSASTIRAARGMFDCGCPLGRCSLDSSCS